MVALKIVLVVMVVVMVMMETVHTKRQEHRIKTNEKRTRHDKKMGVPDEFSEWHAYNERFLAHISTSPSLLNRTHIKPHLNYLLVDLEFLPQVNSYLDAHLANVSSEEQARRVFTLLDLFSAQEPLRHRHLKQIREALVTLFERYPEFVKQTVPIKFVLDGFDRHVRAMKRQALHLYRRVLVPAPSNLNLLAFYRPGRHPALDQALIRHSLPPPFLSMEERQWFQIRLADPPHLTLSLDLLTWRLLLVNHTFSPTFFRFDDVQVSLRAERYLVRSAVVSDAAHLSFPCRHHHHDHTLCFDYQNGASVQVLGLADGEAALIHHRNGRAHFLHYSQDGRHNQDSLRRVPEPNLSQGYPGRGAHWVLTPNSMHAIH